MSTSKSGANSPTNESSNPLGSSDPSGKTSQGLSGDEQRGQGAVKTVEGGKEGVTDEAIKVRASKTKQKGDRVEREGERMELQKGMMEP